MLGSKDEDVFHEKYYKLRSGTTDLGREYEHKMIALFSLRCILEDYEDVWIASNIEGVGAFDDVIIHIKKSNLRKVTYLIQLKHKETPKNILEQEFLLQKGDFSLLKYSRDVAKLKENLECKPKGVVENLGDFCDLYFVIFTNRGVNQYNYLKYNSSKDLSFLNTNASGCNIQKFDVNKLTPLLDDSHVVYADYVSKINLFTRQAHVKQLEKLIEAEIEKIMKQFKLLPTTMKFVIDKFLKFITDWVKGDLGGNYYLTKKHIVTKLCELFLCQYEYDLSTKVCSFYDHNQKQIWNKIIRDKIITVVDYDESVLEFLNLYIGSEIKQHHNSCRRKWCSKLSDEAKCLLYKHEYLGKCLLRTVGKYGEISLIDIYKSKWLNSELPLLLTVVKEEEYENIGQILKLANYKLKVIIVNKSNKELHSLDVPVKQFFSLFDLNEEEKYGILNMSAKLQGRYSTSLENVIDETMYAYIKCKDIIWALINHLTFIIGNRYEPLSEYYIERFMYGVQLKFDVLLEIKNEIFVIECADNDVELMNALASTNMTNIFILKHTCIEDLKLRRKPIHRLMYYAENYIIWRESLGSTKNLLPYILDCNESVEQEIVDILEDEYYLNNTHLLSECPGMGKSTIMDFISLNAPADMWVLKIGLNKYEDYYENLSEANAFDHLTYFNEMILKSYGCTNTALANAVFQRLMSTKKIVILLDGFDEICGLYKNEVTAITKTLHKEGYTVWLTTRPHMKAQLEQTFDTIAQTLKPFSFEDQFKFLVKYFFSIGQNVNPHLEQPVTFIKMFVRQLLLSTIENMTTSSLKFLGIPLQTKLLAEVFSKELIISIKQGDIQFTTNFDVLYLYEEFIKRKLDILYSKFGSDAKHTRVLFQRHQQLFALKYLFKENYLTDLNIDKQMEFYDSEEDKRHLLQRDGVIVIEESSNSHGKFKIGFIHQTFAEFLAAQWFSENCRSSDGGIRRTIAKLMTCRFKGYGYEFLFKMVDLMLAKGFALHVAIINREIDQAVALIKSQPDDITKVDKGGRTILHLLCLYCNKLYFILEDIDFDDEIDEMIKVVDVIPHVKISDIIGSDDFGYNPVKYAIANRVYIIADKILDVVPSIQIGLESKSELVFYSKNSYQTKCWSLYKALIDRLLCFDVLFNTIEVSRSTTLSMYFKDTLAGMCSIMDMDYTHYINDAGVNTLFELYEKWNIKSTGKFYFHDLRFAIAFGKFNNVLRLLSEGVEINKQDEYNNTFLHYAIINEQHKIVKLLISNGADVNKRGFGGNTPLHTASKYGYKNIIRTLLSNGAKINEKNNKGQTPFFVALDSYHKKTAKLLISENADIKIEDDKRASSLHIAAKIDAKDVVRYIISKGGYIDKRNTSGETPLFEALEYESLNVAKFLLANGADINIANRESTCLHYAVTSGSYDIVLDLLDKGFDINKRNNEDLTPLHLAIKNRHINIVKLLLHKGANTDLKGSWGNTVIHYAVKNDCYKILKLLLLKSNTNTSVEYLNIINDDHQTPLFCSICCDYIYNYGKNQLKIVKFLLNCGADINTVNKEGSSILHYLSEQKFSNMHKNESVFCENVVIVFLNRGANINLINCKGKTAYQLAKQYGNFHIAALIMQKEQNPDKHIREHISCCCCFC